MNSGNLRMSILGSPIPAANIFPTMRTSFTVLLLAAFVLAGCASNPQSRIAQNRELYRSFPSSVQRKISAGVVDVGFTPEMVRMALGRPNREFSRQSENGTSEVWVYRDASPRVSFGIGVGSYGRHSASSVGIATSTGGYDRDEKMRVVFRDGQVTEVENVRGR
jgi:hypothetical protein